KLVDNFTLFYHWNVLIYWTILAVVHARDYHRDLEERRAALAELERRLAARPVTERLLVEAHGRSFFVRASEVEWMEAAKNYVRLHVGDTTHVLRSTLGALEERLDPERFRRISRSTLVNLDRVREVQPWFHGDAVVILERDSTKYPRAHWKTSPLTKLSRREDSDFACRMNVSTPPSGRKLAMTWTWSERIATSCTCTCQRDAASWIAARTASTSALRMSRWRNRVCQVI